MNEEEETRKTESAEEINNPEEIEIKESAQSKREKRAAVRQSLREARGKLKELKKRTSSGFDLSDDIVSCKGEIDLLYKEMEAIEDGGHSTFLEAKELIAPKKNVSEKKLAIRSSVEKAKKEISELEKKLYFPNLPQEERDQIIISISKENALLQDLKEELNALKEFNHTRFVLARDENKKKAQEQKELQDLEDKLQDLRDQLIRANQKGEVQLVEQIKIELESTEKRKSELFPDEADPFLEVQNPGNH